MRMRKKKWAEPELNASEFYIKNPKDCIGKWRNEFETQKPLYLEIGCGKGIFAANYAYQNQDINYIALDLITDMLGLAKRNVEAVYNESEKNNILLTIYNVEQITEIFNKADSIDRLFINFCNPWPKHQHKKRRLTHTRQLEKYKEFLADNAEIHFKTDDDELFEESLKYFEQAGYVLEEVIRDLHITDKENIITEHEEMFSKQGIKIKYLRAKLCC